MLSEKQNAILLIAGFTQREINDRKIKFHNLFEVWPRLEPRQWVGLTNKDIIEMWPETSTVGWDDIRLIEAKLKEKNT